MPKAYVTPSGFIWRILVPLIAALAVTLAFSVWTLTEIARQQDEEAERRSTALLDFSFRHRNDDLAKIVRDYASWGQAYQHIHRAFDRAWAYDENNLGRTLFESFSVDYVALIDPRGDTIYLVQDGELVAPQEFRGVRAQLGDLIESARELKDDSPGARKVIGVAGLPTAFVAAPLTTGGDPGVEPLPGTPTVLLFGDSLSPDDLADMGAKSLLNNLRVARDPADAAQAPHLKLGPGDQRALTLRWEPRKPGSDLLRDFGPWLGLAAAVLFVLVVLIVRFARESTRALDASSRRLQLAFRDAEHRSLHDAATGLPNRTRLMAHLSQALAEPPPCLAVVYCDLDSFKLINDTLGHAVGDFVLEVTAARLRAAAREDDLVARVGGDEFVIVARRETPTEVEQLCRALLKAAPQPIDHMQHKLRVGLSIGVALAPRDAAVPGELVRLADIALYQVKARGRRSFRFYAPEMSDGMFARAGMEHELARAIGSGELQLTFERMYDASATRIAQVEARPMWRHPARGLIDAGDFLPLAEETEIIGPLVAWLLKAGCAAAARWPGVDLSVAIPAHRLQPEQLAGLIEDALKSAGLEAGRLELCVSDAALLSRTATAVASLEAARRLGVRLAIAGADDGCPSTPAMSAMRFDVVRVGPKLIGRTRSPGFERSVLRAFVDLAGSFGARVAATGIDDAEQLHFLQSLRCAPLQGPHLALPAGVAELDASLAPGAPRADRLTIGRKA